MKTTCIKNIKKTIEEHFNEELLLDDIARTAGYSKYHLNRMFLKETGQTIHQYIRERRLFEAEKLLIESDRAIVDIALEIGYTSQQSFTLAFRQQFDSTPQSYRNKYRSSLLVGNGKLDYNSNGTTTHQSMPSVWGKSA